MTQQAAVLTCPGCGQLLAADALACPNCGTLVHRSRLEQLSREAQQYELSDPGTAMRIWRQALDLLPQDSQQYRMIYDRMRLLSGNSSPVPLDYAPPAAGRNDTWLIAIFKTGGSMLLSILVYAVFMGDLYFAAGFVLLILIHEMGHVLAMRHYRLSASPPIFIPFLGAMINLRQRPPNAMVEAIVGIGGPVLGSVGAIACFAGYYFAGHHRLVIELAYFGILLNLFNLLPVPPLDGGRVTAAINPRLWILGLVILVAWMAKEWIQHGPPYIMILILLMAWPRIRNTLAARASNDPYYQIPRSASVGIAIAYLSLALVLSVCFFFAQRTTGFRIL